MNAKQRPKTRRQSRRHAVRRGARRWGRPEAIHPTLERLEPRLVLAANLTAHWSAEDLNAAYQEGQAVANWVDAVGGVTAAASGTPVLKQDVYGGRSVVRFDPSGDSDYFRIPAANSPMSGVGDFTMVLVFATSSSDLGSNSRFWFDQTGLIDASQFGFADDWGLSINNAGQVAAGIGKPSTTQFSTKTGLNDGRPHVAIYTKAADTISLYVDGQVDSTAGVSDKPRAAREMWIGAISGGLFPYMGDIAEIRIYDQDLTSDEAAELNSVLHEQYRNSPPVARNDTFEADEDVSLVVQLPGVLANDSAGDGDGRLAAELVEPPRNGVVDFESDGSFVYTPHADFFGIDAFRYQVTDDRSIADAIFTEDFNAISASRSGFNGGQFESGMPVLFGGNLSRWTETGSSTAHAVDTANVTACGENCRDAPDIVNPRDWAVMIWDDNVIQLRNAIPESNTAGRGLCRRLLRRPGRLSGRYSENGKHRRLAAGSAAWRRHRAGIAHRSPRPMDRRHRARSRPLSLHRRRQRRHSAPNRSIGAEQRSFWRSD